MLSQEFNFMRVENIIYIFVANSVSNCKTLSKSENLSNQETLKIIIKIAQRIQFSLKTDFVYTGENVSKLNLSADSVSNCKTLAKNVNLSNPENLKPLLKIARRTRLCRTPKLFQTTTIHLFLNLAQRFKLRLQLALT
jgi:hypothetical protein